MVVVVVAVVVEGFEDEMASFELAEVVVLLRLDEVGFLYVELMRS